LHQNRRAFSFSNFRLTAAEEQYSMNQAKLLNLWFSKSSEIKKQLRQLELEGQHGNIHTKEELIKAIQQLEVRRFYIDYTS
jgi:hypothetical protein